jgi:hypothetical protein
MDCALVFPPLWYFSTVPADLSYVHAWLTHQGLEVGVWNLSAAFQHEKYGHTRGFQRLQNPNSYSDLQTLRTAHSALRETSKQLSETFQTPVRFRKLDFSHTTANHLPTALEIGLDPKKNPALTCITQARDAILARSPRVIALAFVHPDQFVQLLAIAKLIRDGGFDGLVVVYGSLEDVVAPADWMEDLVGEPNHRLFEWVDGVVVGDSEVALMGLCRGETDLPNVLWGHNPVKPRLERTALTQWPPLHFGPVIPEHHPYPMPVVDLRLGRGCSWGRCAFCAIQSHQMGYRGGDPDLVAAAMLSAYQTLGTTFFRIRDDLVTPVQLRSLTRAIRALPFKARWMVRARFEPGFTAALLTEAYAAGLEEVWMGLESASPRVRALMDKGVSQETVVRILRQGSEIGLRIRALCIAGFPGETEAEFQETIDFVLTHQEHLSFISLTPFQLARNSPMSADPKRFGLDVIPDPLPKSERLRFLIPAKNMDGSGPIQGSRRFQEAVARLLPWTHRITGPEPTHDWMHASVSRQGW